MNNISQEDITNSLKVLSEVCNGQDGKGCNSCPLSIKNSLHCEYEECVILNYIPKNWIIHEPTSPWKAFSSDMTNN